MQTLEEARAGIPSNRTLGGRHRGLIWLACLLGTPQGQEGWGTVGPGWPERLRDRHDRGSETFRTQ
jgi:hypothetical protein